MSAPISAKPANFTRRSTNFVAKFVREGRFHLIPLYWLLRMSDFAREGMEHSGSYLFADHMYRGVPSGSGWIGRWIDKLLLKLPATRSMRQRCFQSTAAMRRAFDAHLASGDPEPFRILTIPCGLPRDLRDFAAHIAGENAALLARIHYTGIDIDPQVIEAARAFLFDSPLGGLHLDIGDALDTTHYPVPSPHFITSTGLGEFLDDVGLTVFYRNVFSVLAPGGTFFTSAAARGKGSDVLLRAFELDIHYRTSADLCRLLRLHPWKSIETTTDSIGLQTFIRATKG